MPSLPAALTRRESLLATPVHGTPDDFALADFEIDSVHNPATTKGFYEPCNAQNNHGFLPECHIELHAVITRRLSV